MDGSVRFTSMTRPPKPELKQLPATPAENVVEGEVVKKEPENAAS